MKVMMVSFISSSLSSAFKIFLSLWPHNYIYFNNNTYNNNSNNGGVVGGGSGMGRGLVGVITRPASGVVDFASSSFEGIRR